MLLSGGRADWSGRINFEQLPSYLNNFLSKTSSPKVSITIILHDKIIHSEAYLEPGRTTTMAKRRYYFHKQSSIVDVPQGSKYTSVISYEEERIVTQI